MSKGAGRAAWRLPRRKLLAAAIVLVLVSVPVFVLAPRFFQEPPPSREPASFELRPAPLQPDMVRGPSATELAMWAEYERTGHLPALLNYMRTFPDGHFSGVARARLDDAYAAKPAPPAELRPGRAAREEAGEAPAGEGSPPVDLAVLTEPAPPPPPPPAPAPAPPPPPPAPVVVVKPTVEAPAETVTVSRFPTLDAPADAVVGEEIEVMVALTEEQFTPDVSIRPSGTTEVTSEGMLEIAALPASDDGWLLDVELSASGFTLAEDGSLLRQMRLEPYGDSEFLYFRLRANSISSDTRQARIQARFVLDGRYLGSVSRPVLVRRSREAAASGTPVGTMAAPTVPATTLAAQMPPTGAVPMASVLALGEAQEIPDLTVILDYEDPARLGRASMTFYSPHFRPVRADVETSPDLERWLGAYTARMAGLVPARGASPMASASGAAMPAVAEVTLAGLGRELYRYYVPDPFKQVFWRLKDQGKLRSIQITSNNTAIPWELVRPERPDGGDDEFLGVGYRLARWALRDSVGQDDAPRDRLPFAGVAAIAPPYAGGAHLSYQEREVQAMSRLAGFRRLPGDFASVRDLLSGAPQSFVHFSGHGQVSEQAAATPVFAIMLTDTLLEPSTWQAMLAPPFLGQGTFYFFNACDVGQSGTYAGFLQGWGPTLLQSGASGFIGGMWPLPDRSAADFSEAFYARLAERLQGGPVHLADVLRETRARFYETGDPTYLAYAYYGNVNLTVTPP